MPQEARNVQRNDNTMGTATGMVAAVVLLAAIPSASASADQGVRVKVVDPTLPIRSQDDISKAEDLKVLRLVGPRNGYCSAQVVVTAAEGRKLKVALDGLKGPGGTIASDAVTIRYARKASKQQLGFQVTSEGSDLSVAEPYYDVLDEAIPPEAEIIPVWVTVKIPAGARPGEYKGTLTVGAANVPVRLEVGRWQCPPPAKWITHVGVLSSPETLARHYKTDLWSQKHWGLVERELTFLGGLGNKDLWLSIFAGNCLGQEKSWITYTEESGKFKPDLRIVEQYLKLYKKRVGPPKHLLVEMWNSNRYRRTKRGPITETEVVVDGKSRMVPLPGFEGSEKTFVPLLEGLRKLISVRACDLEKL